MHYEAQGWRDKENSVPMTHDTIFGLMSMTKPIVSAALMMLFEEGGSCLMIRSQSGYRI